MLPNLSNYFGESPKIFSQLRQTMATTAKIRPRLNYPLTQLWKKKKITWFKNRSGLFQAWNGCGKKEKGVTGKQKRKTWKEGKRYHDGEMCAVCVFSVIQCSYSCSLLVMLVNTRLFYGISSKADVVFHLNLTFSTQTWTEWGWGRKEVEGLGINGRRHFHELWLQKIV